MINTIAPLLINILLSSVLLILLAVVVLLALKYKQYRSRPHLLSCLFFLFQALGIGGFILISIINGDVQAPFDTCLRPATLITGFSTIVFMLAYLIDIKLPGKLNIKTFLLATAPFVTISVILLCIHPSPLHSPMEVFDDISRPDKWLRLILVLFFIIYPVAVACLPYEWRQCLVSRRMIVWLHILSCIVSPIFVVGLLCGYFPAVFINYIIAIIFDALVVYIELKIRIPVSQSIPDNFVKKEIDGSILNSSDIWMNPDLTADELATILGTSHKYLLKKIKELGYTSFPDMINHKRIEYICKGLEKNKDVKIISLMFEAGFRSSSTAYREFKRIVGCSPSEYQHSI